MMGWIKNFRLVLFSFFLFFAVLTLGRSAAEASVGKTVEKTVADTIKVQKTTDQSRIVWKDEKEKLVLQYEKILSEKEFLEKSKNRLDKKTEKTIKKIDEHKRRLEEIVRVNKGLGNYLDSVCVRLKEVVRTDLPFLKNEREQRLKYLEESVEDSELSPGEKFRRVMEALEIETDYGNTVEGYDETIEIDGNIVAVDILRLGRLSLFFLTKNNEKAGIYNSFLKKWTCLGRAETKNIKSCLEMAKQQRTIDFVNLPIGEIISQ